MAAPELRLDPRCAPFGVAVSGGADSLALLLSCRARGLAHRAVTVDHGLRPEAGAEAAFVAEICAARGIPHDILRLGLSDGPALQARARDARYGALAAWAQAHGLGAVLLGHTANDIAETFLMRLSDGAGLDGLAAMEPRVSRGGTIFLRPLHTSLREDLLAFVQAEGIDPVEDPSNVDPRFERARARRLLSEIGIEAGTIAASAMALRMARRSLSARTRELVSRIVTVDRGDWLIARDPMDTLLRDDPEQARRVLLSGLSAVGGGAHPPRRRKQEELLRRMRDAATTTLAGCLLVREAEHLRLSREPEAALAAVPVSPGEVWDGRWRVTCDGPVPAGATVRALAEAVAMLPWRDSGLPRRSLMASPAVWSGDRLLAAPLVRDTPPWRAELDPRGSDGRASDRSDQARGSGVAG